MSTVNSTNFVQVPVGDFDLGNGPRMATRDYLAGAGIEIVKEGESSFYKMPKSLYNLLTKRVTETDKAIARAAKTLKDGPARQFYIIKTLKSLGNHFGDVFHKVFPTQSEEHKSEELQNNDLASRLGLNTTNGKVKFLAAILLTGLAVGYFTTRGSEKDCSAVKDALGKATTLLQKETEKCTQAAALANKAKTQTQGLYAVLNNVCTNAIKNANTCPNAPRPLVNGCSEEPVFKQVLEKFISLNKNN